MIYEAEARVAGALRGGTYNDKTQIFFCHCPKPQEFKIRKNSSVLRIYYPDAKQRDVNARK